MPTRRFTILLTALVLWCLPVLAQQSGLDVNARTGHQRALEEVYWQHRLWPAENPGAKPSLDQLISTQQLQQKAEDSLRLSNALEKYWHISISGQQLQAEIARMAQNSHQPEVLRELFSALDNDAHVIAETMARPVLAERLARSFYEHDSRFHSRAVPFEQWWDKVKDGFSTEIQEPTFPYSIPEITGNAADAPAAGDSWKPTQALPEGDTLFSFVWTGTEMIIWGGTEVGSSKFATGSRYNPATDTWKTTATTGAPMGRRQHTAVWTGTEMIVWGGCGQLDEHFCDINTGGRYNPATEAWAPTSLVNAPHSRLAHTAVWSGTEMIVWGGCSFINDACRASQVGSSGGRYNPSTDTWVLTSTAGAPSARTNHTAVWTGSKMIVWGGFTDSAAVSTGGVYNPTTDTWTATAAFPANLARYSHTAVWTGSVMIIWGGTNGTTTYANGGRYNPTTNTWQQVSPTGAPGPRALHAAVWTGNEMVVWGGLNGTTLPTTGGRYNPTTNKWRATSTVNAPTGRAQMAYVWTGSLMVIWGGGGVRTGGRYDPVADTWTATNANEAASARQFFTATWTGTEMVVWGGDDRLNGTVKTGSRYNPATDSWAATTTTGAPSARHLHSAVWTGTEIIIYGGANGSTLVGNGARYNPTTNSWQSNSSTGAPAARSEHAAVWTGTEMIVFGGSVQNTPWSNTGGRFNPSTNTWTSITTVGAPSGRDLPAAVWSGTEMIVWGGATATFDTNTGARYNPATNTWTTISTVNAPSARNITAAVWTGSRMLIWGGQTYSGAYQYHNDGALYDPVTDTWTPTTQNGAPSERGWFSYVWTGNELIVFGGGCAISQTSTCDGEKNTGGRYNPATDSWVDTTTVLAPSARSFCNAVWTGDKMIVWGGIDGTSSTFTFTGGAYTPGP